MRREIDERHVFGKALPRFREADVQHAIAVAGLILLREGDERRRFQVRGFLADPRIPASELNGKINLFRSLRRLIALFAFHAFDP